MASLRRIFLILTAFVVGNFLATNVLLAGKVLTDFRNLKYYSQWEFFGGPPAGYLLLVLTGTLSNGLMALFPAVLVLIFSETLRIRSMWFYVLTGGLGAFLFDIACIRFDIVSMRSFCVQFSLSELAIVTIAGLVAGYVFWRIAGSRSGKWRAPIPLNNSGLV
jgi:hypothetical protein